MRQRADSRASGSLLATLAVGVVGVGGIVVAMVRKRARRRHDRGELVFSKASAGLWPPVPHAPDRAPRIDADLAGETSAGETSAGATADTESTVTEAATGAAAEAATGESEVRGDGPATTA